MKPTPPHAPPALFPVKDDCLLVGGKPLPDLAAEVGRTPFFAYDRSAIERRVDELRACLPDGLLLYYAVKANPMAALVRHMADLTDGMDVASAGELRLALDAGTPPERISFAGPGKREEELAAAIRAGVHISLESERELETVAGLAESSGQTPRVGIRINPDFELAASGMKMGGGPRPFGVDAERVPAMLRRIGELGLRLDGLHVFAGSQNLRPEAIIETHARTMELLLRLADEAPNPPGRINIGGGLGIPYFPGEQRLDPAPIGEHLHGLQERLRQRLPQARMIMELGRYLVGEAGAYVCRIIDRKISRGEVFLVTDGGMHHHLAASGNLGQVIRRNFPLLVADRVHGGERERVNVVGPLCTPLDVLGKGVELARAEVGDLIVVMQSGAYGPSASPAGFLSHPPAVEVLV